MQPITRFEDAPEYIEFKARREEMEAATHHRDPYFIRHDSALTDTSIVDGERKLNFASYNYVGMSGRKEVSEARIGFPFRNAPFPVSAQNSSLLYGCQIRPATGCFRSHSAMETADIR